jgi:hypothetical protein
MVQGHIHTGLRRTHIVAVALVALAACEGDQWKDVLFGPSTKVGESPPPTTVPPAPPLPAPPPALPDPGPEDDGFPRNTQPVAQVTARVYFIECGGAPVPNSDYATEAPVGCRLHLDCTPRDAYHQPTRAWGEPEWALSDPSLVKGGRADEYTPTFQIVRAGTLVANVVIDGVRSNNVVVGFF